MTTAANAINHLRDAVDKLKCVELFSTEELALVQGYEREIERVLSFNTAKKEIIDG